MKIQNSSEAVNNSGLTTQNFGIKETAHLYKVLYSSLYEDKEQVVLGELAANALDAHMAAGKADTPIKIALPSEMDPYLVVTDEGIGMDLETITNVYSTYGQSTKSHENQSIGGFGYGSKSPFSLSDSFTVVSVKDGIKTAASCFLDKGTPKFAVFSSEPSDEPSGTTITVPVADETVQRRFRSKAKYVFLLWDVKPTIIDTAEGDVVDFYKKHQLIDDMENVAVVPLDALSNRPDFSTWNRDSYMGLVAVGPYIYKLPTNVYVELLQVPGFSHVKKALNDMRNEAVQVAVIPRFKIGELELSPGREKIETTQDNSKLVKERYTEIADVLFAATEKSLAEINKTINQLALKKGIRKSALGISQDIRIDDRLLEAQKKVVKDPIIYLPENVFTDAINTTVLSVTTNVGRMWVSALVSNNSSEVVRYVKETGETGVFAPEDLALFSFTDYLYLSNRQAEADCAKVLAAGGVLSHERSYVYYRLPSMLKLTTARLRVAQSAILRSLLDTSTFTTFGLTRSGLIKGYVHNSFHMADRGVVKTLLVSTREDTSRKIKAYLRSLPEAEVENTVHVHVATASLEALRAVEAKCKELNISILPSIVSDDEICAAWDVETAARKVARSQGYTATAKTKTGTVRDKDPVIGSLYRWKKDILLTSELRKSELSELEYDNVDTVIVVNNPEFLETRRSSSHLWEIPEELKSRAFVIVPSKSYRRSAVLTGTLQKWRDANVTVVTFGNQRCDMDAIIRHFCSFGQLKQAANKRANERAVLQVFNTNSTTLHAVLGDTFAKIGVDPAPNSFYLDYDLRMKVTEEYVLSSLPNDLALRVWTLLHSPSWLSVKELNEKEKVRVASAVKDAITLLNNPPEETV